MSKGTKLVYCMNIIPHVIFSTPELKKFCSWSSDSQELESFSQGSNFSDTSNPSIKKDLLKFEVARKSEKLNILSESLSLMNVPLPESLKVLDIRVIMM